MLLYKFLLDLRKTGNATVKQKIRNATYLIISFVRRRYLRLHLPIVQRERWSPVAPVHRDFSPFFFFFSFRGDTHKHTHRPVEHKSSSIRRIINSCTRIGVSSRMAHETRRPSGLTRRDRTSSRSVWCPAHVREAVPSTYCSDVAFHLTHCDPVSNLARVIPLSVDAGLTLLLPR